MKISIIKLLEYSLDGTKTFSVSSYDEIYSCWSDDITFSERKNVIERTKNYMMPIMIHVIMYCCPDKYTGGEETIKSNERELINKWLLKNSNSMLKIKKGFTPERLSVLVNRIQASNLVHELKTKHGYRQANFNHQVVNEIQRIFLVHWSWLINKKLVKGDSQITYNELAEMLKVMKNDVLTSAELKNFRL